MHEHMIETHRGAWASEAEGKLNALATDGWRVVAAYAVPEGASTVIVHHFVLVRDLDGEGQPIFGPPKVTVEPSTDLIKIVGEAKAAVTKAKGKGR